MRGAVIVGIDHYPGKPLTGCSTDALKVKELMARNFDGSPNFETVALTSKEQGRPVLTANYIKEQIRQLVQSEATVIYIHFSGHAEIVDGEIVLLGQDDSPLRLQSIMALLGENSTRSSVVTLDCCFSGSVGRNIFLHSNHSVIPDRTAIISSSRKDERSWEKQFDQGQFSSVLCEGLAGRAADVLGNVTVTSLYAYLDESFGLMNQRPTLKASLNRVVGLRTCRPRVPLEILRSLPDVFESHEAEVVLDPRNDGTNSVVSSDRTDVSRRLQQCVAANLAEPVSYVPVHHAAVPGRACRLTSLGKRYWSLAKSDRV